MKKQRSIPTTLFLLILLLSVCTVVSYAQTDDISLPQFFYGKAVVNGRDAPIGSIVTARIDGEKKGEITVGEAGAYGNKEGDNKLGVPGSESGAGKNIAFYIKMPGFQEIKAAQAYQWESGAVTNLDLSFTGEEIEAPKGDDTTPDAQSSTGGAAGGGGAGMGAAGEEPSGLSLFQYDIIEAGRQIDIVISAGRLPLTRLQLILANTTEDVNFDFEPVDNPDVAGLDNVYTYLSIKADNINEDDIKVAILKFKVPNTWFEDNNLDPEKVGLFRYADGVWNELTTLHEGADAENNYYRAQTPGFSYFAIKSDMLASAGTPKSSSAQATGEDDEGSKKTEDNRLTGMAVKSSVKGNPFIALVTLLSLMLAGILLHRKGKYYN